MSQRGGVSMINELVLLLDAGGMCLHAGATGQALLDPPLALLPGRKLTELLLPAQAEILSGYLQQTLAEGRKINFQHAFGAAGTCAVTLTPLSGGAVLLVACDTGAAAGVVTVNRDEPSRPARESEKRSRAPAETATDAIITINSQSEIVYVNWAAKRIFGYDADALLGQPLHTLMPEYLRKVYDSVINRYDENRHQHAAWAIAEFPGLHQNGHEIPLEISFSEFTKDDERFLTGSIRVVTERRGTEEKLRQMNLQLLLSQKLEAVGTLTGGIAHEFRNILTSINMHNGFLRKKIGQEENLQRHARGIAEASQRAKTITDQLLAFSRREIRSPTLLDVNEVIREVIETTLPRIPGLGIDLQLAPVLSRVLADRTQLGQVLLNLLVNASDAMPQGGTITISTDQVSVDEETAQRRGFIRPGSYVRMIVADTGMGMDAETQAHIFEPFFTTKEVGRGTGLGLSMVYGIIKVSKGYVLVSSSVGEGTSFEVFLPPGESVGTAVGQTVSDTHLRGYETILLVEDEQNNRELFKEELREYGYQVLDARHGEEGLQLAESYLGRIDLMISDVRMPEMGGEELARRLRATRPEMKVLLISGYPRDEIKMDETDHFLQKPFAVPFVKRVREILNETGRVTR